MNKEELRKRVVDGYPYKVVDYWAEIEKRDKEITRMAGIITDRTHELVKTTEEQGDEIDKMSKIISSQSKELMTYEVDLAFAQGRIKELIKENDNLILEKKQLEIQLSYYADKNQNQ